MSTFLLVIVGFISLCIGSFLNVVIYRVPRELSVIHPHRSFCPKCKRQLTCFENIPVISWLLQMGKCRGCKEKIPLQYPLVEILSLFLALVSLFCYGLSLTAVVTYALAITLLTISFIDLEFKIIPNVISFPGMAFGLLLGIISQYTRAFSYPITQSALDSLLGFLIGGGSFYLIGLLYYFFTKRVGIGGGDIKLLAMTGAILGISSVYTTIFVGSLVGAVVGIALVAISGGGRHTEIPFGPWLSLGALFYMFFELPYFRF